jgi:outer membrane biosynthesis protein TonB
MFSSALLRRAALAAQRSTTRDLSRALLYRNGSAIGSTTALTSAQRGAIVTLLRTYATSGTTSATKTTKKAGTKTAKKTTKKPKKTAAKKKPAKKPAPKKRKVLTEKQKEAKAKRELVEKRRDLKATALLGKEPDALPSQPYLLFVKQQLAGSKGSTTSQMSGVASKYRNLSVSEREVNASHVVLVSRRSSS